jgi:hypothetical protein
MYYLLIKEIEQTGLKYLCKRKQYKDPTDHIKYKGSGKLWRRIIKSHPEYTIKTTVLGLFSSEELKDKGEYYSDIFNVVESKEWANLIKEVGDGGDTSKTQGFIDSLKNKTPDPLIRVRKTIHNPETGVVKRILPNCPLPKGFVWGNLKGRGYGPKPGETEVYNDGNRKIYINKNELPPPGFSKGLHYDGTTKNKIGYYNPKNNKKVYLLPSESPPEGFVKGLPPTTNKQISTPYGMFRSIQDCMDALNLTRYEIKCNLKNNDGWRFI